MQRSREQLASEIYVVKCGFFKVNPYCQKEPFQQMNCSFEDVKEQRQLEKI
jgi:hypothetical protein